MRGFIDLHSHWIARIDDGAKSVADGIALLRGLHRAGFSTVVATPHMRPGMFDNDRAALIKAFEAMLPEVDAARPTTALPEVHLSSEHWFDDIVFDRLKRGQGVPYPSSAVTPVTPLAPGNPPSAFQSVLIEFPPQAFPSHIQARLYDLRRAKLVPIIAHPERYQPVWKDDACLDPLLDAGAHLLLDVCSLVGKYGRASQKAAEKLIDEEAYEAACSDAHKPEDVDWVVRAIARLEEIVGQKEAQRLLSDGPRRILKGEA